jgi:cytochrome c peroxidase
MGLPAFALAATSAVGCGTADQITNQPAQPNTQSDPGSQARRGGGGGENTSGGGGGESEGTFPPAGGGGFGNGGGGFGNGGGGFGNGGGVQTALGCAPGAGGLVPLSCVPLPTLSGGDLDPNNATQMHAAVVLGKALFWDMQAGSDGQVACATCHFNGGADDRTTNVINPGPNAIFSVVSGPDAFFSTTFTDPLGFLIPPAIGLVPDDIHGSQGVAGSIFVAIDPNPAHAADITTPDLAPPFGHSRRVTGRQAPSVINAAFAYQVFWDGRANDHFNAFDPFGNTANTGTPGSLITHSTLASQATGPALSSTEMSAFGRGFNGPNSLGAKLMARPALQMQIVSPTDSVLGAFSAFPNTGMQCAGRVCTYQDLVNAAFPAAIASAATANFSRIWGQAVQAYERTLISDQTPLDVFLATGAGLTLSQQQGLGFFTSGRGQCSRCHNGPLMSDNSIDFITQNGLVRPTGGDAGFHNIGVRPTSDDAGRAGFGPLGATFSQTSGGVNCNQSSAANVIADCGAFKTPTLRNVGMTAPYTHAGDIDTLEDMVAFYSRAGNFQNPEKNAEGLVRGFSLNAGDQTALVDFLRNGLLDPRVLHSCAPFDRPSIALPNGPSLAAVGAAGDGRGSCFVQ